MSQIIIDSGKSNLTFSNGVSAYVCSGATITNCKVTSGGRLYIERTGAAKGTIVSSGGFMAFSSGCKSGGVNSALAGGYVQIGSGAIVNSITASNGAIVRLYAGAATSYTVTSNGATLKCSGSSFSDWDMKTSGNSLDLIGLSANSIKVSSGCTATITQGAIVKTLNVYSGGEASLGEVGTVTATVHAGGEIFFGDPAITSATIVENGGNLYFFGDDDACLANSNYHVKIKANTFRNVTISGTNGKFKYVTAHSGTTAVSTTLYDSAVFDVYSGGRAYDTVLLPSHEYADGGRALGGC